MRVTRRLLAGVIDATSATPPMMPSRRAGPACSAVDELPAADRAVGTDGFDDMLSSGGARAQLLGYDIYRSRE
jgi:hypothetical protein